MKYFNKRILFLISIIYLVLNGCQSYRDDVAITSIYNDLISRIVNDNYRHCFPADMKYDNVMEAYLSKNIDDDTYGRRFDSLKKIRMSREPKCTLDISDEIVFSGLSHEDIIKYVTESLEDPFVDDFFGEVPIENVLDSILVCSKTPISELVVPEVQLISQVKDKKYPWGHGMGQLGLSKCFVNRIQTKAIVYYEFLCGPKCGKGEMVFLSRNKGIWEIEKSKNVWIY